MTTPAPHTLSAQLRRRLAQLRSQLLAHPLATSMGVALFALALRRLLSQLRRRLPSTTAGLPAPRFVLDAHEDFHAFVFSSDGICIAHGREPSFVGKALQQVFANEEIEDSADMHERFLRAAAAGGGWCTYSWRTSPAVLRLKGAYIFGVDLGGGKHGYAGVGYALCPPASAGRALGLYGFVCNGEGRFVAHATLTLTLARHPKPSLARRPNLALPLALALALTLPLTQVHRARRQHELHRHDAR